MSELIQSQEAANEALHNDEPQARTKRKALRFEWEGGHFARSKKGVTFTEKNGKKHQVCGHVRLTEIRRSLGSDAMEIAIRIHNCLGAEKVVVVPMEMFVKPRPLMEVLVKHGLAVPSPTLAIQFLARLHQHEKPLKTVLTVRAPGWHLLQEEMQYVYVVDGETFAPAGCKGNVVLASGVNSGFSSAGTLEEWNAQLGDKCVGNPRMEFAVCAALSGPLLKMAGQGNCSFHIHGKSRVGKSTTLSLAGSLYGRAYHDSSGMDDVSELYAQTWNATANALEITAMSRNDGVLLLDELGECPAKSVSEAVYHLVNGRTKRRMTSDAKLASGSEFHMVALSNGEPSIHGHLIEGGIKAARGQMVRMASIPSDTVFEELHGQKSTGDFGQALVEGFRTQYGTLGPAFIRHVVEHQDELRASLPGRVRKLATRLLESIDGIAWDGTHEAVAKSMALASCAGKIAIEAGLLNGSMPFRVERAFMKAPESVPIPVFAA